MTPVGPTGRWCPVWVTEAPFYDADGQLVGIIGVSSDISELEAARVGLADRVRQQAVVAELGQYALHSDDPRGQSPSRPSARSTTCSPLRFVWRCAGRRIRAGRSRPSKRRDAADPHRQRR
jgi:transcriptional regulator of acetoin/glycerol metabolism